MFVCISNSTPAGVTRMCEDVIWNGATWFIPNGWYCDLILTDWLCPVSDAVHGSTLRYLGYNISKERTLLSMELGPPPETAGSVSLTVFQVFHLRMIWLLGIWAMQITLKTSNTLTRGWGNLIQLPRERFCSKRFRQWAPRTELQQWQWISCDAVLYPMSAPVPHCSTRPNSG